jgi:hypothetical protein
VVATALSIPGAVILTGRAMINNVGVVSRLTNGAA